MHSHFSALIVDDELHCRQAIKHMLETGFQNVRLVGMAANCNEARAIIQQSDPDLVFLDIAMPNETGFDLLRSLPGHRFQVIFVTAYDQFAVRAFRANAIDYLLKPVLYEELQEAIAKAARLIAQPLAARESPFDNLDLSLKSRQLERITLQSSQGFTVVDLKDIQYLEADTNYTHFHIQGDRKVISCHPLKDYEEVLEPEGFMRVHRSYMINMRHLRAYSSSPSTEAILKDGTRVEVSRRRAPLFQQEVRKWTG